MSGALDGIRVLDLSTVGMGPYATQTLGDMGAEIIKIEPPAGDIMRGVKPARHPGMGAIFMNLNRNKRSLVLDFTKPAAHGVFERLVTQADVLVHSLRPKAIAKFALDYETVRRRNAAIVYCNAWGFGRQGPKAGKPAYDDIIQAESGLADLSARIAGQDTPAYAPNLIADKVAGMMVTQAVLTALFHRERTGAGQEIEVPMFEVLSAFNLVEHLAGQVFEPAEGDMGYTRILNPYRRPYATQDGFIAAMPYSAAHWRAFLLEAGETALAEDPRLDDPLWRSGNIERLYTLLAEVLRARPTADWQQTLDRLDIPHGSVNSLEDLRTDPHLQAVGFFVDYDHPSEGRVRTTQVPVQYSETPGDPLRRPPPRLGEHSREILTESGLSDTEIDALLASGATIDTAEPEAQ